VTVYGVAVTFLLIFPWALVVLPFVHVVWSWVARKREHSGKKLLHMSGRSASSRPESPVDEVVRGGLRGDLVTCYHESTRRAA
jgi:hypothetical protein